MAGASTPLYYWDTCLFLAWLGDEQRKSGEMDGVREVIARHKRREVKLCTSVLTSVEVLESKIPAGIAPLFEDLLKRLTRVGLDSKIAAVAHGIRDHYARQGGKMLTTPDAIHLATAIVYRVDEFHTFDSKGSGKTLGLLPLSGNVGGHNLKICIPEAKNPQLDLPKPKPSNATPATTSQP
jgi:predicted nucleic acid-binding protein